MSTFQLVSIKFYLVFLEKVKEALNNTTQKRKKIRQKAENKFKIREHD